ncbi:hypothetical protein ACIRON_15455 [Nocardioides sp. NPDC101246]|uniref:hypothetical protein n=1 Tax=unclassified Nocardioides TaxID=2615069 RepID=UPI00088B4C64|nr:hypothetical protein [Nocardioides sp. YR527]SDJ87813.1 hypothetical protein SAMN05428985_101854 [Nocardioides sp. YR527]
MSEQYFDETPAEAPAAPSGAGTAPHTGVARVDAVLETLDRLDELPLNEHVGVFEAAHTELRRALDPDTGAHDAMARIAAASGEPQPTDQP